VKTFATQAGLAYTAGQRVRAAAGATAHLEGDVVSYSGNSLVINATTTSGTGTFESWTFGIAGTPGAGAVTSVNGQVGNVLVPAVPALDAERIAGTDLLAIVDANDRVVLYAEQDGTAVYPGLRSLGLASLDAIRTGNTQTEEVWGIGHAIVHSPAGTLQASDRVAFYVLDDGTVPFARADAYVVDGVDRRSVPDHDAVDYNIHLNSGQSLAVNGSDGAIIDPTDLQLNAAGTALVPIANGGSYGLGLCATEQLKFALKGDPSQGLLASPAFANDYVQVFKTNAFSGTTIAQLSPGASPDRFAENITAVQSVVTIAAAEGKVAQVPFVTFFQGESNVGTTGYKQAMKDLKDAYNAQVLAITKQPNRFAMLIYQLAGSNSAGTPIVGKAQWEAWQEDPEIVLVGPLYPYKYTDSLHMTSQATKWFGQQAGKVAYLVGYLGRTWKPLHPLSARLRTSNVVTIKLHVPAPPIVLDTTTVPAGTNFGFRVFDATGEIAITSVAIVNGDTVRLKLASTPGASPKVEYAWRDDPVNGGAGNFDGNGTHAIRGNVRDSDPTRAVYGPGFPLWNWLVRFEMAISI
jgi:hypothetical protein